MNNKYKPLNIYFKGKIRDNYQVHVFDDSFRFIVKDKQNKLVSVYNKYSTNGMAILSASRAENTPEQNKLLSKQLQADIRAKNLGYVSTLGGFVENKDADNEAVVTELSFIVPYNAAVISKEDFFDFVLDMCKKYNQDSVLLQVPWFNNGQPTYLNKNGAIDMSFSNKRIVKPGESEYFTQIKGTNKAFEFTDSTSKRKIYFGKHVPGSLADAYIIRHNKEYR